uniref:Secreted protein n=1 Tax=Ascaris lumbricoides TaxID=6252 RepID=A0A0M3HYW1_ASCLU
MKAILLTTMERMRTSKLHAGSMRGCLFSRSELCCRFSILYLCSSLAVFLALSNSSYMTPQSASVNQLEPVLCFVWIFRFASNTTL